jgi:hypothetical protein
MPFLERTYGKQNHASINEVLISSDSHVIEPAGLWQKELPKAFQDRAPIMAGKDPTIRPEALRTRTSESPRWRRTVSAPKSCILPMG